MYQGELQSKKDFQELMHRILDPLKPYYSEGRAFLSLGATAASYDERAIAMEAFSRPLWALVPYFAGGGQDAWFAEAYRRGLASGTDPEGEEYWGSPGECDQRFVEMAAIAYAILFAGETFWKPLASGERDALAAYLYTINEHEVHCCNWLLFRVLVNIGLKTVGKKYDSGRLEEALQLTESFYLGSGWYRDGGSGQKDYYVSFAIHFYSLIYARVMETEDPRRSCLFKERAMEFARQFIYWFDEDGEGLPFGRSLTYRFAEVSFFSACLLAGIEPFSVSVMKGLIVRHLKYWMSQPIFDRCGVLTIGYAYPNLVMAERYNAPGSPYWSMKAFAFLILPDEHPFWSAEAAPLPEMPVVCRMPEADMLVRRYGHHVTAYTPGVFSPWGNGQSVSKYGKFAYDTKFGFSVAKSCYELHENSPDSMLAFWVDGYVYVRRICEASEIRENAVWSRWTPCPGVVVETTVIPTADGHRREHRIVSEIECEAYDCGFSVAADLSDGMQVQEEAERSRAENRRMLCEVQGRGGSGTIIAADPNTNLLYPKTVIPAIRYRIQKGEQTITTEVKADVKKSWNCAE